MKICMIAAMSNNRAIGKDNTMPWHLPSDLRFFKESTMGKPIIMGRKTFESIGRALPGRPNFVITRNPSTELSLEHPHVWFVCDLENALKLANFEAQDLDVDEVMIIGGAQIYAQALPIVDRIYLTRVNADIDGDTFFPEFDEQAWTVFSEEHHEACEKNPYGYCFQILDRK